MEDLHGMKPPNYFEGVLQLRNVSKEVYDYVQKLFTEEHVTIAKTKKQKEGEDYWVSSNKALLLLQKQLPKRFSGQAKLTRRLFSKNKQSGK